MDERKALAIVLPAFFGVLALMAYGMSIAVPWGLTTLRSVCQSILGW